MSKKKSAPLRARERKRERERQRERERERERERGREREGERERERERDDYPSDAISSNAIFILGPCPPTLRPPPSRMVGPVTVNVFKRCDRFWCF